MLELGGLPDNLLAQLFNHGDCETGTNNINTGLDEDTILAFAHTNTIKSDFDGTSTNWGLDGAQDIIIFEGMVNDVEAGGGNNVVLGLGCCDEKVYTEGDIAALEAAIGMVDADGTSTISGYGDLLSIALNLPCCGVGTNTVRTGLDSDLILVNGHTNVIHSDWDGAMDVTGSGPGEDIIMAMGISNTVYAGGGNDIVIAVNCCDEMIQGDRSNTIEGARGTDRIFAVGEGTNRINASNGDDFVMAIGCCAVIDTFLSQASGSDIEAALSNIDYSGPNNQHLNYGAILSAVLADTCCDENDPNKFGSNLANNTILDQGSNGNSFLFALGNENTIFADARNDDPMDISSASDNRWDNGGNDVVLALGNTNNISAGGDNNIVLATNCCMTLQGYDGAELEAMINQVNFVVGEEPSIENYGDLVKLFLEDYCCVDGSVNNVYAGLGMDLIIVEGGINTINADWDGSSNSGSSIDRVLAIGTQNTIDAGGGNDIVAGIACCDDEDIQTPLMNNILGGSGNDLLIAVGEGTNTIQTGDGHDVALAIGCCDILDSLSGLDANILESVFENWGYNSFSSDTFKFENYELILDQVLLNGCCDDDNTSVNNLYGDDFGDANDDMLVAVGATNNIFGDNNSVLPTDIKGTDNNWLTGGNDTILAIGQANNISAGGGSNLVLSLGCCDSLLNDLATEADLEMLISNIQISADTSVNPAGYGDLASVFLQSECCDEGVNNVYAGSGSDVIVTSGEVNTVNSDWNGTDNTESGRDRVLALGVQNTIMSGGNRDIIAGITCCDTDSELAKSNMLFGQGGDDTVIAVGDSTNYLDGGEGEDILLAIGCCDILEQAGMLPGSTLEAALEAWVHDDMGMNTYNFVNYEAILDVVLLNACCDENSGNNMLVGGYGNSSPQSDMMLAFGNQNVIYADNIVESPTSITDSAQHAWGADGANDVIIAFGQTNDISAGGGNNLVMANGCCDELKMALASTNLEILISGVAIDGAGPVSGYGPLLDIYLENLCCEEGVNTVYAGIESDFILASGRTNLIHADWNGTGDTGTGQDVVVATGHTNTIYAGDGNDLVVAANCCITDSGETNEIFGGAGNDRLFAVGKGTNTIRTGPGNDYAMAIGCCAIIDSFIMGATGAQIEAALDAIVYNDMTGRHEGYGQFLTAVWQNACCDPENMDNFDLTLGHNILLGDGDTGNDFLFGLGNVNDVFADNLVADPTDVASDSENAWATGGDDVIVLGGNDNNVSAGGGNNIVYSNNCCLSQQGIDGSVFEAEVSQVVFTDDDITGYGDLWETALIDIACCVDENATNDIFSGLGLDLIMALGGVNTIYSDWNGTTTPQSEGSTDKIMAVGKQNLVFSGAGDDTIWAGACCEMPLGDDQLDNHIFAGSGEDIVVAYSEGNNVIRGDETTAEGIGSPSESFDDLLIAIGCCDFVEDGDFPLTIAESFDLIGPDSLGSAYLENMFDFTIDETTVSNYGFMLSAMLLNPCCDTGNNIIYADDTPVDEVIIDDPWIDPIKGDIFYDPETTPTEPDVLQEHGDDTILTMGNTNLVYADGHDDVVPWRQGGDDIIFALGEDNDIFAGGGNNVVIASTCCEAILDFIIENGFQPGDAEAYFIGLQLEFLFEDIAFIDETLPGPHAAPYVYVPHHLMKENVQPELPQPGKVPTNYEALFDLYLDLGCCDEISGTNDIYSGLQGDVLTAIGETNTVRSDWDGTKTPIVEGSQDRILALGLFNNIESGAGDDLIIAGNCCEDDADVTNTIFAGKGDDSVLAFGDGVNTIYGDDTSTRTLGEPGKSGNDFIIGLGCCDIIDNPEISGMVAAGLSQVEYNETTGKFDNIMDILKVVMHEPCCDTGTNVIFADDSYIDSDVAYDWYGIHAKIKHGNDFITAFANTNFVYADGYDLFVPWDEGGDDVIIAGGRNNNLFAGGGNNIVVATSCCEEEDVGGNWDDAIALVNALQMVTFIDIPPTVVLPYPYPQVDLLQEAVGYNDLFKHYLERACCDEETTTSHNVMTGLGADLIVATGGDMTTNVIMSDWNGTETPLLMGGRDKILATGSVNTINSGFGNDIVVAVACCFDQSMSINTIETGYGNDIVVAAGENNTLTDADGHDVLIAIGCCEQLEDLSSNFNLEQALENIQYNEVLLTLTGYEMLLGELLSNICCSEDPVENTIAADNVGTGHDFILAISGETGSNNIFSDSTSAESTDYNSGGHDTIIAVGTDNRIAAGGGDNIVLTSTCCSDDLANFTNTFNDIAFVSKHGYSVGHGYGLAALDDLTVVGYGAMLEEAIAMCGCEDIGASSSVINTGVGSDLIVAIGGDSTTNTIESDVGNNGDGNDVIFASGLSNVISTGDGEDVVIAYADMMNDIRSDGGNNIIIASGTCDVLSNVDGHDLEYAIQDVHFSHSDDDLPEDWEDLADLFLGSIDETSNASGTNIISAGQDSDIILSAGNRNEVNTSVNSSGTAAGDDANIAYLIGNGNQLISDSQDTMVSGANLSDGDHLVFAANAAEYTNSQINMIEDFLLGDLDAVDVDMSSFTSTYIADENFIGLGEGNDRIMSIADSHIILSLGGDNEIVVHGTDGISQIDTSDGNDTVVSRGALLDMINTGDGDDTILSGAGADELIGGAGSDTFMFDISSDIDYNLIADFDAMEDILDLSGILELDGMAGLTADDVDMMVFDVSDNAADVVIQVDAAGDHSITLAGIGGNSIFSIADLDMVINIQYSA
ncbi:MAG: hypothetical protein ACPGXY_01170 [Alphaproteobacteria bacterium]